METSAGLIAFGSVMRTICCAEVKVVLKKKILRTVFNLDQFFMFNQ